MHTDAYEQCTVFNFIQSYSKEMLVQWNEDLISDVTIIKIKIEIGII